MPQWPPSEPGNHALTDEDLDRLSDLLERHAVPQGGMSLEMVDGFMSALAVGPEPVPANEYEPEVWGSGTPAWNSGEEASEAHALLMRLWNSITRRVRTPPEEVQTVHMPVLGHPDHSPADDDTEFELGKEWAIGFIEGVAMREKAWDDWRAIDWVDEDLAWLAVLAGYEIDPPKPLTWAERDAMVAEIPDMLYALNEQRLFQQSPKQPIRSDAKPGRNDPCPCGSGQKYKKCCGVSRTLH